MNNLNPTRIVDKNGKLTTVHKRADQNVLPSASLASLKPTLSGAKKAAQSKVKALTKVKASSVSRFHEESFITAHAASFEVDWLEHGREYYGWRKDDMEIPSATLYDFMRKGIDLPDAAALTGLDITPASLEEEFADDLPGRLGKVKEKGHHVLIKNQKAIDAMEEAGVPPLKAFKVLENGLQDGHMANLSIDQLVPLFSKWRYYGVQGSLPDQNSSRLIDAVTAGKIPIELTESTTRQELSRLENEMRFTKSAVPLKALLAEDKDLFLRLTEKAVKTMNVSSISSDHDKPALKLLNLYNEHGKQVLDLRSPELLHKSKRVNDEWTPLTLDEAVFIEEVEKIALDRGDDIGVTWNNKSFDDIRNNVNRDVKLNHSDLAALHGTGMGAETAHEMMVLRKMNVGQAVTAYTDNVPASMSEGAL